MIYNDNFTFLVNLEGALSKIARFTIIAILLKTSDNIIINTPDRNSILLIALTIKSNYLAISITDYPNLIIKEYRNFLDNILAFFIRSSRNIPPNII